MQDSLDLFDPPESLTRASPSLQKMDSRQRELGQYMTPFWAAEALVERYFADLDAGDAVLEPTCGTGAFLAAIPAQVRAMGVEIDPRLADAARRSTGRRVITGDFTEIRLDMRPTAIVGNPPFDLASVSRILERSHQLLPNDGRVGFILPAYALQTPSRVMELSESWSIETTMLPRTLFKGLQCPLTFVLLRKDRRRLLLGMALYPEQDAISKMPKPVQEALHQSPQTWRTVVEEVLDRSGGRAPLQAIYAAIEPRRPTPNPAWREKVRQTLQRHFRALGGGEWALKAAA